MWALWWCLQVWGCHPALHPQSSADWSGPSRCRQHWRTHTWQLQIHHRQKASMTNVWVANGSKNASRILTYFTFESKRFGDLVDAHHRSVPDLVQDVWKNGRRTGSEMRNWAKDDYLFLLIHIIILFFILRERRQKLKTGSYFGAWKCGESIFEAPRLHLQRLGRSGRIHFLSAAAFFVLSWMALSASSELATGVTLSTPLEWSSLLAWGHTGPFTGFSLDEGTDGMAYPGEKNAIRVELFFHE